MMRKVHEMSERNTRLPDPTSRPGAVFYAAAGALIVSVLLTVLQHVHIAIHLTWR